VIGGNTNYKATIRHAELLQSKGIDLIDSEPAGIWAWTLAAADARCQPR
jgi:6-phosphogluconate dehydrogenase (decarboxylating)